MVAKILLNLVVCACLAGLVGKAQAQQFKFPNLFPFKKKQTVEPIPLTDEKPKKFIHFPKINLFPQRPSSQPGMMDKLQSDSKQFFQNTGSNVSNWFSQTGQGFRLRTEQTWSFMQQSFNHPIWPGQQPSPPTMIQPGPRSAFDPSREAKIRF